MAYSEQIIRQTEELLARRRMEAQTTAEEHRAHLHALSEDARALDSALARIGLRLFEIAKEGGEDCDARIAHLKQEHAEMLNARRALLASLGLPEDYTKVKYTCPLCSDTGYVMTRRCECMKRELVKASLRASGIGSLIDGQSFENFSLSYYQDKPDVYAQMQMTFVRAEQFANEFPNGGKNLLLLGGTGLGKTHLSTAIARRVIERGYEVVYESAPDIFADFEHDRFRRGYASEEDKSEKYNKTELLIIDDLGAEFSSTFTVSCLYALVNGRLSRGLSTVISTNLTPHELNARYDERLTSRFFGEYTILQFAGTDIRQKKLREP